MIVDHIDIDAARERIAATKPTATMWNCTPGCYVNHGPHEDGCYPIPTDLDIVKAEAFALCDEVERLRGVLAALDVRMVQPYMSGGGYYTAGGELTADQAETVFAALTPKDGNQ